MKFLLPALGLFASGAMAANNIFGSFPLYPQCERCLDTVFASCPGFYQDRSYAECMCGGKGGTDFVTCSSVCGSYDSLAQRNAIISWCVLDMPV
jgi:hypothetical protein